MENSSNPNTSLLEALKRRRQQVPSVDEPIGGAVVAPKDEAMAIPGQSSVSQQPNFDPTMMTSVLGQSTQSLPINRRIATK